MRNSERLGAVSVRSGKRQDYPLLPLVSITVVATLHDGEKKKIMVTQIKGSSCLCSGMSWFCIWKIPKYAHTHTQQLELMKSNSRLMYKKSVNSEPLVTTRDSKNETENSSICNSLKKNRRLRNLTTNVQDLYTKSYTLLWKERRYK